MSPAWTPTIAQRDFLRAEVARFDPALPVSRAWTPPASWYTSPDFFDAERAAVIASSWQPVARRAALAAPGDYVSGTLVGEPWVVVHGEDGELRAFYNTCRHKGREVVQGCGNGSELVCGYHAWSYDHRGRLRRAPKMGGIEAFDREEMGLRLIAMELFGPWVMLNLDGRAAPLGETLGELPAQLDGTGWDELTYVDGRVWDIGCNWKVYVDNYLDGGYHIPHMHPTLDAQLDMQSYRTELFQHHSIQSSRPAVSVDPSLSYDAAERIGDAALYVWLFPNFMLNRYGPCLDTNWVVPVAPDRCQVHYEFYFRDTEGPEAEAFIAESIAQAGVTQREDIAICESVQLGLQSTSYDRGRYAPKVEIGEHHFHGLLADRLGRALAE